MKTTALKTTTRIVSVLMIVLIAALCFSACGDGGSGGAALHTVDGVEIKAVEVSMVGDTANMIVTFRNTNDKTASVEMSKLAIKTQGGETVSIGGLTRDFEAGQTAKVTSTFMHDPGVKVGDTVDVLFGDTVIATVQVGEF